MRKKFLKKIPRTKSLLYETIKKSCKDLFSLHILSNVLLKTIIPEKKKKKKQSRL